jgi:ArsR family transcriptional regulator
MATTPISPLTVTRACQLFKLLGDEARLRLLLRLAERDDLSVSALCEVMGQTQPAVSHHLTLLRAAGVINFRREGKQNFYYLASERVRDLLRVVG